MRPAAVREGALLATGELTMKNRVSLVLLMGVIALGLLAANGLTQTCGCSNDVTVSSAQPSTGQVAVSGTYTVESGYTFGGIAIEVRPSGGATGEGGLGPATTDGMGNFSATLSVPTGQYDVQAFMLVTDGSGTTHFFFSNTIANVSVP
jgi:hypothetical protein